MIKNKTFDIAFRHRSILVSLLISLLQKVNKFQRTMKYEFIYQIQQFSLQYFEPRLHHVFYAIFSSFLQRFTSCKYFNYRYPRKIFNLFKFMHGFLPCLCFCAKMQHIIYSALFLGNAVKL